MGQKQNCKWDTQHKAGSSPLVFSIVSEKNGLNHYSKIPRRLKFPLGLQLSKSLQNYCRCPVCPQFTCLSTWYLIDSKAEISQHPNPSTGLQRVQFLNVNKYSSGSSESVNTCGSRSPQSFRQSCSSIGVSLRQPPQLAHVDWPEVSG